AMHAYILLKAKAALGFGWVAGTPLLLLFVFFVIAPLLIRLLTRNDYETAARSIAVIGFVWMGFLFFLVCINIAADFARFFCWSAERFGLAGNLSAALGGRGAFLLLVLLAAIVCVYSIFEARDIRIVNIRISTDKLPPETKAIRIAQISDLHLGLIHRNDKARRVADLIAAQQPDILVSTGDMVDDKLNHIGGLAEIFSKINAPLGKFAVSGNHEYYVGLSNAVAFTKNAGFTLLQDESVVVNDVVRIVGINDPVREQMMPESSRPEVDILDSGANDQFTILLKHRPAVDPASVGKFDLQLSGHSHQGQIFPFLLLTRLAYPYSGGNYTLPWGATLHVNRGTGTWGPPMRFLAPPEITIIDIETRP
ncbi:MAG: metallophosphoesterase, partial [Syntrophorhabdaceae bacterium]|nr:metallophosphoesterase [Syntrophorhabdaceae bacterium]